jgi:hypothetical protein
LRIFGSHSRSAAVVGQQGVLIAGVGLTAADADILHRHQEQVGRLFGQLARRSITCCAVSWRSSRGLRVINIIPLLTASRR